MRREDHGQSWGARVVELARRLFPERQIILRADRRLSQLRLTTTIQVVIASIFLMLGGWATFSSVSYVLHGDVISAKDDQIADAQLAYRSLLNEVADYQKKFTDMSGDLEEYHEMMQGLAEQNARLQQNLTNVAQQLRTTEEERERIVAARESLKRQLLELEEDVEGLSSHNFTLKDNLDSVESELQSVVAERNKALFEGGRMRRQIKDLEGRLAQLEVSQQDVVQRLTEQTVASVDEFEKVVELTGLDVERLVAADSGLTVQQGGPFFSVVPEPADNATAGTLRASLTNLDLQLQQLESLQTILRKMPLTSPMDYYHVTSSFGKRRDPFNRRWAMHYGLDMGGPYRSPIYATAPGVVTFAGRKGNYGRLIEIDHGAGIKTRYGHLHKLLVKRGDKIKFRQKIGVLGSSGRSTGAHLHYEVLFAGRPRDPMKFIKAGQYVFQG